MPNANTRVRIISKILTLEIFSRKLDLKISLKVITIYSFLI